MPENPDDLFRSILSHIEGKYLNQRNDERTRYVMRGAIQGMIQHACQVYGIDRGGLLAIGVSESREAPQALTLTPTVAGVEWRHITFEVREMVDRTPHGTLIIAKYDRDQGWGKSELEAAVDLFERRADRTGG